MYFSPTLDMTIGFLAVLFSFYGPLYLFIPVTLIEAYVLKRALPQASALIDSFIMNLVSTAFGVAVGFYIIPWASDMLVRIFTDWPAETFSHDASYLALSILFAFIITWALSVLVEGVVLKYRIRPFPTTRKIWVVSILANSISYGIGLLAVLFWWIGK